MEKSNSEMDLLNSKIGVVSITSLVDAYFAKKNETQKNFQKENESAILIQKTFRGYLTRKRFQKLKKATQTIKKYYKGYKARELVMSMKVEKKRKERMDYYNECAKKIQACFRGYISRKKKFDFYKRKQFLEDVEKKGKVMEQYIEEKIKERDQKYEEEVRKRKKKMFKRIAPKLHYLVSTKNIPGVLNNSILANTSTNSFNTMNIDGLPIEEALKKTTKNQINIKSLTSKPSVNTTLYESSLRKSKLPKIPISPIQSNSNSNKNTGYEPPIKFRTKIRKTKVKLPKIKH